MLNRRILRIKAFKALYAYAVTKEKSLQDTIHFFDMSCEASRDLYLFMLCSIPALTKLERERIEALKNKINPTKEEKYPNTKFADNLLAKLFLEDADFKKLTGKKNFGWDLYFSRLAKIMDSLKEKDYYKEYMNKQDRSLADDCDLFIKIFKNEIADNPDLDPILEEKSIFWQDELDYVANVCCKTLSKIAEGEPWHLIELYQSDILKKEKPGANISDDNVFIHKLLKSAYLGYDKYFEKITSNTPEWDASRLYAMDTAIIILCLAERDNFPEIDKEVSMNEWIEISKFYSLPGSYSFINGIFQKILN